MLDLARTLELDSAAMTTPIGSLFLVLGLWFSMAVFCCSGAGLRRTHKIKYRVDGTTTSASLTYENESGNTEQISMVRVPWEKTLTVSDGTFLYISAQNQEEYGTIRTWVEVDDKAYQLSTSQGGYTIATSSMRCCP